MRRWLPAVSLVLLLAPSDSARAEVTRVFIESRTLVAGGASFGTVGPYEKLVGQVEIALDPDHARNKNIVDLEYASRAGDGRVHVRADLYVLRPRSASRGNGVLLFDVANRGHKVVLGAFNRAPRGNDPTARGDFGNGFLMREGFTIVWVGWQFDVGEAPLLGLNAPAVVLPPGTELPVLRTDFTVNTRMTAVAPMTIQAYPPARPGDSASTLRVRDALWDEGETLPRDRWRFTSGQVGVTVQLEGGFEPGRTYELAYRPGLAWVAGVGLAAIRDVASFFRFGDDAPVRGRHALLFGASQSGRFIHQFLYDGFNADERDRRVFDAVWPHTAGSSRGSFNHRLASPGYASPTITQFPFSTVMQEDRDGNRSSLLELYAASTRPKLFATNTSYEYWGGRAAALTHVTANCTRDLELPEDVRVYLFSGTQHVESPFPPRMTLGQAIDNPTPQPEVMQALLRGLRGWVVDDTPPPDSRYPRLADGTLVPIDSLAFPRLHGVPDPRTIEGPGRIIDGEVHHLPHLVPQVDEDGNEMAGIRVPEIAVPLATATGWNFRADAIGNPTRGVGMLGSYIPFPVTQEAKARLQDPRVSVEERYSSRDDYLRQIRVAGEALVADGYLLSESLDTVLDRARAHWEHATRTP